MAETTTLTETSPTLATSTGSVPASPSTPTIREAFASAKQDVTTATAEPPSPPAAAVPPATEAEPVAATSTDAGLTLSAEEIQSILTATGQDQTKLVAAVGKALAAKAQNQIDLERQGLAPYRDFIAEFDADPQGTLAALAPQYGLQVVNPAAAQHEQAVEQVVDDTVTTFRKALGPELDFLADRLAPAVEQLATRLVTQTLETHVGPLAAQQEVLVTRAAKEHTDAILGTFSAAHPDWHQHEAKMVELGSKLHPSGMDEGEFLELLYHMATKETAVATGVKKALDRMKAGATTDTARTDGQADTRVRLTPPRNPTIREAFEAAKRGDRWGE